MVLIAHGSPAIAMPFKVISENLRPGIALFLMNPACPVCHDLFLMSSASCHVIF
jgi:hypothetical protein